MEYAYQMTFKLHLKLRKLIYNEAKSTLLNIISKAAFLYSREESHINASHGIMHFEQETNGLRLTNHF